MAHELVVVEGPDRDARFELAGEIIRLGRHTDNDIIVSDSAASRFHAEIHRRGGRHVLVDLGSTHGTYVNDVRNNQELLLENHDEIRIGQTLLVFREKPSAAERSTDGLSTSARMIDQVQAADLGGDTVAYTVPLLRPSLTSSGGLSDEHTSRVTQVAEAIQSVLDLDELLGTLMDLLMEVFHPERGLILLRERAEGPLVTHVARPGGTEFTPSQTIVDYALQERKALLVADASADRRVSDAASVMAQSILSAVCAPLLCKENLHGLIYLDSQAHQFSFKREDLALLSLIAANAGIAIENAMLVRAKLEAERLAAMGVAIAGISHYAKNILTGVRGSSTLIEKALEDSNFALVREAWPILQRSNGKISSLIQDMLTYSKPREPDLELGSLNLLAEDVANDQQSRADERGVELRLSLERNLPSNFFDAQGLHDSVLNLVGNAIEACEGFDGAVVEIKTAHSPEDGTQRLEVIDSGPGIPPDVARRIFEPFFSTKGSKGTGLGLAVARKIAEEHGGGLTLETQEGLGTTFTLSLPFRQALPED